MDQAKFGLIVTLLLGLFILIGALIAYLFNRKEKIVDFSIGLAFGVISMLIITDLLPEILEHLELKNIFIGIIFSVVGFLISSFIDKLIPDHVHDHSPSHNDHHHNKKECSQNLIHIGVITSLTIALHNIIEGMAVYSTMISSTSLGIALTIGVGCHNIPLGMVIAGAFYQSGGDKYKIALNLILVSLSTFVGGLIMFFLNLEELSPMILEIFLSITLGMLLYIIIDELLPRIRESKYKNVTFTGILIGVIILIIGLFI